MRKFVSAVVFLTMLLLGSGMVCAQAADAGEPASWFRAEKVAENVWCIHDSDADNMYLVEGTEKALLIDTGLGVANLKALLETLTKKPVTVVNTHGHPDHAGGNYQFSEVYAHPADFESVKQVGSRESRTRMAERMRKGIPGKEMIPLEEALKAPLPKLIALKDGMVFDLGGRKLEVIEVPGHTPGEVVLLDAANKMVFTGDNDNTLVWLFLPASLPLDVYAENLKKLQKRDAEFDTIYPGHGAPLPDTFVGEQIACVESILNGTAKSEPQHYFAGDAMVARYKTASVAFDPAKLRSK